MKTLVTLALGLIVLQSFVFAQPAKDPRQDITLLEKQVKALQTANRQANAQIMGLKQEQAGLQAEVGRLRASGDSLMKASMDSAGIANMRSRDLAGDIKSVRASLSFQQNLLMVALVLVCCLFLLFLWQRRTMRTISLLHEADINRMHDQADRLAGELSAKISQMQDLLSETSLRTHEKVNILKNAMAADLAGIRNHVDECLKAATEEHQAGIAAERNVREEGAKRVHALLSTLEEKLDAGLEASGASRKQAEERYMNDLAELRKGLLELAKKRKARVAEAD